MRQDQGASFGPGSRESVPWLHVRGQFTYHSEALISGTKAGLIALRDALNAAIEARDAEASVFANDGEGYSITIRRCARLRDMGSPPYIDQLARDVAESERNFLRKTERYHRDLWTDRWSRYQLRDSDGSAERPDAEERPDPKDDSAGPKDIAQHGGITP